MDSIFTIGLTISFVLWMLYLAYRDGNSFKRSNEKNSEIVHKDYKSIIVSIGVLGTFTGIIIGLWDFDTTSIKDSVPLLLEGLKTAFITSVAGMFLSISLSIFQKNKGQGEAEDELAALNSISSKLDRLNLLDGLEKLNRLDSLKHLDTLPLMNTKLDSIDTNIKVLSSDISSVKEELRLNQSQLFEFLEKSLKEISYSLDEALNKLAEGANKEIIKALENVIKDFNNNLTEQFGDNFKQLNESVKNMITWQDNYKGSVESMETTLKVTLSENKEANRLMIENIESSSQSAINNLDKTVEITKQSNSLLIENLKKTNDYAINNLNEAVKITQDANKATQNVLEESSTQARQAFEEIKNSAASISDMTSKYERIAEVSTKLESVINTNENQINNLEMHLQSLKNLGEDAKGVVKSVEDFSKNIQGSLTQQSQVVTELTQELGKQMPQSIEQLNKALTSIVTQFVSDYEGFLGNASKMMRVANKVA